MTTQEKVNELCKDFLQRNDDNFTSVRRSGRIGWEDILPKESAYSQAMISVKTKEDLHKVAYQHARDMIVAMNAPFKVDIRLSPDGSYTDHKIVNVATDMFDDEKLTPGEIIDIFTGLTIHEGCHLLYTTEGIKTNLSNRIIADLFNIIEDERIEMLCGEERPGFANFLGCTKYYYFDRYSSRMEGKTEGELDKVSRLFNSILSMIRYPKSLVMSDVEEFADALLKVKEILIPYPSTCDGALNAATRIYDIIKDFYKQEQNKQENDARNDTQSETKKDTQNQFDSESNDDSNPSQSGVDDQEESESSTEFPSQDDGANEESEEESESSESQSEQKTLEESLNDILEAIEHSIAKSPNDELDDSQVSKTIKENNYRLGRALSGEIEIGVGEDVNVYKPCGDEYSYRQSLSRVKSFVPAMANVLRSNGSDTRLELRGLRSGHLDTNKLAEAIQGVENIYQRSNTVRADKMAVCILVDESGSMEGEKIQAARDTAVLLNEALKSVKNIDLYVYGHTTEGHSYVKINVYREGKADLSKYAIGSIEADWSNRDSLAIREAAARIRQRTQDRCLFFVISDGAPCEPLENVRKAVADISKDGFSVVSIGIDFEYDPSLMYDNHVSLTDMSRLAPELGKMIKKAIMKNTKIR